MKKKFLAELTRRHTVKIIRDENRGKNRLQINPWKYYNRTLGKKKSKIWTSHPKERKGYGWTKRHTPSHRTEAETQRLPAKGAQTR